jgi:hypothetical protein
MPRKSRPRSFASAGVDTNLQDRFSISSWDLLNARVCSASFTDEREDILARAFNFHVAGFVVNAAILKPSDNHNCGYG